MKELSYNGYVGSVELSLEDNVMHGRIKTISDLVTYEGKDISGLKAAFEEAVDDYIATCGLVGKEAERKMAGTFDVQVGARLGELGKG